MKIAITSDQALQSYHLRDLNGNKYEFQLDKDFELAHGWYELRVDYVDTKIELSDIKINDSSIGYMMYTGFYTDGLGEIHSPGNAVWDTGGFFTIWIHTEIGMMYNRIFRAIRSGDWGKNLFNDYALTVDRPTAINENWPAELRSFFSLGHGPQWWHKQDTEFPWKRCDVPKFDVNLMLEQLDRVLPYSCTRSCGPGQSLYIKNLKDTDTPSDLPFVELNDIDSPLFIELATSVGYKRIIDISIQTLIPNSYVEIHRDDHYKREAYPFMKGCKKLYWACEAHDDVYFKLGDSGLLPLDSPLLINTIDHTHAVVHQGTRPRKSLLVYGEM